jgi:hypothetical protein
MIAETSVANEVAVWNEQRGGITVARIGVASRAVASTVAMKSAGTAATNDRVTEGMPGMDIVMAAVIVGVLTDAMASVVMTVARRTDAITAEIGIGPAVATRTLPGHHSPYHPSICLSHHRCRQTDALWQT